MPGRTFAVSSGYRYGFNGKEKDPSEFGSLTHYDYGFRIYNPAIAKFLSVDAMRRDYPFYGPYNFAGNKPIVAIDRDGLQEKWVIVYESKHAFGGTWIDRHKVQVCVDKETILRDAATNQRVAITHVTVIDPSGNVKSEGHLVENVNEDGKMANGFYPTAKYNLADKNPQYEIGTALEENGFAKDGWESFEEVVEGLIFDTERHQFSQHLATSPEKSLEFEDLDKAMTAVTRVSPTKGLPVPKPAVSPTVGARKGGKGGKGGDIEIGPYKLPKDVWHPGGGGGLKDEILKKANSRKYEKKIGKNPDVNVNSEGKIVLEGQGDFKWKSQTTDLDAKDFFEKPKP